MNRTILTTTGVVALLLVGLSVPLVLADGGSPSKASDHRDAQKDREQARKDQQQLREDRRDVREDRIQLAKDRAEAHAKAHKLNGINVSLSASGVDQDNHTWTITASGVGLAKNHTENGTVDGLHGFLRLNATLRDANGTIVKQGVLRVRLVAHENDTGEWKWALISVGETPRGIPRLFLHGTNLTVADGSASGTGVGFALVKPSSDHHRVKIKLDAQLDITKL